MSNVALSRTLSDSRDTTSRLRKILEEFAKTQDDMMPAQILSYDRTTNRATVKIMVQKTRTDGTTEDNSTVASVPVLQLGGGGFVASFPVAEGDVGWLKSNDMDVTNFLASLSNATQNTFRRKSFSDAIFIPDNINIGDNITSSDADKFVLQKSDGSVKITLSEDSIVIEGTQNVEVRAENVTVEATTAQVTVTTLNAEAETITATASETATISAPEIILDGNVTITGNVIFGGVVESPSADFSIAPGAIRLGGTVPVARQGDGTSDGATITDGSSVVTVG